MKVTKHISSNAARIGQLPVMQLALSLAKDSGKEISDKYFNDALYQMYCR